MQASWVRQGTSTTGTGSTITLDGAPDAGFIGYEDAFASGVSVPFQIEDGGNRLTGYGVLASGANWTLTLSVLFEKLESGVYTKLPATGLNLSGNAVVGITASAMSVLDGMPNYRFNNMADIGDTWGSSVGFSNFAFPANNRAYFEGFTFIKPRVIDRLFIKVGTADAANPQVKGALYMAGVNGGPAVKLDQVTFNVTTTGAKIVTFTNPILCVPATYFTAVATDSNTTVQIAAPSYRNYAGGSELGRAAFSTSLSKGNAYEDLGASWTDLPASPSITPLADNAPVCFMGTPA